MTVLRMLTPHAGLRVLVTGGASGIGLVIARAFVEAGSRVHVCDASQGAIDALVEAGNNTESNTITATFADVSDVTAVERVFTDVQNKLGGLDVLVNNAGIAGPTGGIDDLEMDEWKQTVDVNLNAQFYFARRAVPLLRSAPNGGAIIALSSVAGRLGYAYRTPYSATKWAVVGLTKSLAIELGPLGIRVNAIQPGIVKGPRIERVIEARARQLGISYEQMEKQYLEKISLRRMTTPEEVAATALFLCSPGGSGISGQAISVCGNVEVL
ncbi:MULTISPECIES: SDR family oxidoreductase [Paraburkholderia]|jgi:Dehydrogenases with different specificities (related to short-chain alcohol dehydrogenases)|uniref:SDR family oxidoreductase n=1 Tax=Paraburkholderia TaxID=1822464 RepID=UPI00190B7C67|nr:MULTISPECIES: SDR family oxidoreductase [Paraburkholderia]MBK3745668.1 SDR family oxidoreductase [Paraburkholderia aspalathi]MBK5186488.1 SDR family oxidoreductase [Burkholderia sp. R-69749]CAE6858209.1 3-beta-hydroxycholanate 3-dehydrogenase (NADP(+)) [Paraburkholderia nemoris]CAE6906744.1 3-beta-hydroxycholanate 3-dehydrogenase (NADP(+)) [Paraburkholderia domus]